MRAACRPARDVQAGTLGRGFSVAALDPEVTYGGGFVDCSKLYVTAASETEGYAMLLEVDLVTGDRRVVSGAHGHGRQRRTIGRAHGAHRKLADLDGVHDVAPGPDGALFAFVAQPSNKPTVLRVVRVERRSGDRSVVWEWRKSHGSFPCDGAPAGIDVDPTSFAMGPDGSAYYTARDGSGYSLVSVGSRSSSCRVVSRSARDLARNVGEGPALAPGLSFPRFSDGKVWALDQLGLVSIDVSDGTRERVTSAAESRPIGRGDDLGSTSLALTKRRAWTAGGASLPAFRLTIVDLETGERHGFHGISGPLEDPGIGTRIWHYPGAGVAVVSVGGAFAFFDPKTGVSNSFSR